MFGVANALQVALFLIASNLGVEAQIRESHSFTEINQDISDGNAAGWSDVRWVTSAVVNVSSVQVKLSVAGEFNGDLYGYVRHVSANGTNFCVILNRPGRTAINPFGYADAGFDVTFDDRATNDVHSYQLAANVPDGLPLTGIWKPDGRTADPAAVLDTDAPATSLSTFTNVAGSGEWTLFLADLESGGTNILLRWELDLSGAGNTATTMTLTSSANPTEPAQPIVFTANATAVGATPEGVVAFCDGSTVLGTVCLSGGHATLATSALGIGNHIIAAGYAGSVGFCGSTNTLSQTVHSPLRSVAEQMAYVLMPVVLTNLVLNSNWLSPPLTFGLGAGAPVGACVGSDGAFCWVPSKAQARSTNVITVWMTDRSQPPVRATNAFTIIVEDYLELALGRTAMRTGQTSSVPVTLITSIGLTNLEALVQVPEDYLIPLALSDWPSGTGNAILQQQGPNVWQMDFTAAAGQAFQATQQLASVVSLKYIYVWLRL